MKALRACLGGAWVLAAAGSPPGFDPFDLARPFVRTFGVEVGLPSSVVYGLSKDSRGRLWAATQGGAAVFDGQLWTPVTPPGAKGPVRAILHATDGALWLGGEYDGLWRLKDTVWSHFNPDFGINTLLESKTVRPGLYAGTRGQGLLRWEGGQWLSVREGLDTPWIWSIREFRGPDGREALWLASQKGVWCSQGGAWERLGAELPQLGQSNGIHPSRDANGNTLVRVSIWRQGLATWDGTRWTFQGPDTGFPSRLPTTLFGSAPPVGSSWPEFAGTYDRGLLVLEDRRWRVVEGYGGGGLDAVYCGLPDMGHRPAVWLGTRDRGVGLLDMEGWRTLGSKEGLLWETVTSVAEGAQGLWVGTSQGLCRLADGRVQEMRSAGAPRTLVNSIFVEPDGRSGERLWVPTPEGLYRFEGGRWQEERGPQGAFAQGYSLLRSTAEGRNRLWLGTEGGLGCLENGQWRLFTRKEGLPAGWIYSLAETPGALWLGTRDRGVVRFQGGVWSVFSLGPNQPAVWCNALLATQGTDGRRWLWAAFVGQGVGRLEIGKEAKGWRLWDPTSLPGFPSPSVFSLSQDQQGRLYLGTRGGLARLTLTEGASGPEPSRLEVFTDGDGLPSGSISYFGNLVDRRGRIWVGTGRGLGVLDPAGESVPPPPPPLFLDSLEADGRLLAVQDGIRFDYRQSRFQARFQWPLSRRREDARFRTQLMGLEKAPGPWRPEAEREFTGLASGKYQLRLWARDHLGREVGPVNWSFEVLPPPWATWWAWSVYGLALVGLTGTAIRWRTRRLEAQAHALEAIIDTRTRDIADALQEATSAKIIAEFEREDASLAREEAEQARLRAEEASRSKSSFLANMSHEIRTPMNAVMGFSQLGQKLETEPKAREYFQKIATASRSLLGIINDILDFSKVEAGKLELEQIPFQLSKVLDNLRDLFAHTAQEKRLTWVVVAEPGTPDALVGDPLRLGQVLINLTGNAFKFTRFGEVSVRVRADFVAAERTHLQFIVEDTGIGMTLAQLGRLFEPFAQADSSTTRKFGGTGLGLTISRRIVELMGSDLVVTSAPEQGSTFSFSLNLGLANPQQTASLLLEASGQQVSADTSQLDNLRVLLVEDNPINQEVAREILKGWKIAPRIASSGAEALRILERESFDVVLMDVQMPDMDGYQTTGRIRQMAAHALLPILAMTANAREQDRQACLEAGMNDFVAKPIETDHLLAALVRWTRPELAAASPPHSSIKPDVKPALPLFDRPGALRRLGGNEALLNRLLEDFRQQQTGAAELITTALAEAAFDAAERVAHTLKGVAGNLGTQRLAAAAGAVEKALRAKDATAASEALEDLTEALRATLAALEPPGSRGAP